MLSSHSGLLAEAISKWKWSTRLRFQLWLDTLSFHTPLHSKITISSIADYEDTYWFQKPSPDHRTSQRLQTFDPDAPEPNSTNLLLFLKQIQGPLPNHSRQTKRSNLTSLQRYTLKKLGSNPDLVIKPFDKRNGICLMVICLYINKIE